MGEDRGRMVLECIEIEMVAFFCTLFNYRA